jgi:THO complex subunit 7
MSSVNEDEIIKKRLLIEGDSGNEDRCINKLIKLFIKWCNNITQEQKPNIQQDDDFNEVANAHEMMLAVMSHIEFGLMRNQFILDMNKQEQDNYENLYKNIDYDIEKAKNDIVQSKLDLQEARKIRKNRQEYDVLAHDINNYPDRQEMQATIERLDKQLEQLKDTKTDLNHKIELRRKQFTVLLKSLSSLKVLLENDQYNDFSQLETDDGGVDNITDSSVNESKMEMSETDNEVKSYNHHHRHSSRAGDYFNEPSPNNRVDSDTIGQDEEINVRQPVVSRMEMDEI